jgi:hypothetical protein
VDGDRPRAGDDDTTIEPALQRSVRILGRARHVLVVGMHPQLAARSVDDVGGLAVVVGVGVRTHDQPRVLEAQVDLCERALQMRERTGLVHAGVEQDDAVARGDRPGVAMRHAGEWQRQPEPPHAGHDALAAPGGDDDALLAGNLNPFKRKGIPPVAYWSGIRDVPAGAGGVDYAIPDTFNGSLRVLAVGVNDRFHDAIGEHDERIARSEVH